MHYTKLISEEHFTAGCPLVIMLPLAEEDSISKEIGYLIQELHISGRWRILLYNVSNKMNGIMYTEIHQHCGYIILISETCAVWEYHIPSFWQQLYELSEVASTRQSWNPRAKFVVSVMSNCTHFENIHISRVILELLWLQKVMNSTVLYLQSNKHGGTDLKQNRTDSAQGSYVELHAGNPYENSDRCIAAKGTVPLKVFTVRNLSDIRKSEIIRGYFDKNFHRCPINVYIVELPFSMYSPTNIWYNDSNHQYLYVEESEAELVRVIGKTLKLSMRNVRHVGGKDMENIKYVPTMVAVL